MNTDATDTTEPLTLEDLSLLLDVLIGTKRAAERFQDNELALMLGKLGQKIGHIMMEREREQGLT
jgi:hypothetical protein